MEIDFIADEAATLTAEASAHRSRRTPAPAPRQRQVHPCVGQPQSRRLAASRVCSLYVLSHSSAGRGQRAIHEDHPIAQLPVRSGRLHRQQPRDPRAVSLPSPLWAIIRIADGCMRDIASSRHPSVLVPHNRSNWPSRSRKLALHSRSKCRDRQGRPNLSARRHRVAAMIQLLCRSGPAGPDQRAQGSEDRTPGTTRFDHRYRV